VLHWVGKGFGVDIPDLDLVEPNLVLIGMIPVLIILIPTPFCVRNGVERVVHRNMKILVSPQGPLKYSERMLHPHPDLLQRNVTMQGKSGLDKTPFTMPPNVTTILWQMNIVENDS